MSLINTRYGFIFKAHLAIIADLKYVINRLVLFFFPFLFFFFIYICMYYFRLPYIWIRKYSANSTGILNFQKVILGQMVYIRRELLMQIHIGTMKVHYLPFNMALSKYLKFEVYRNNQIILYEHGNS